MLIARPITHSFEQLVVDKRMSKTSNTNKNQEHNLTQTILFKKTFSTMSASTSSQVDCPGDGNLDGVVDQTDIEQLTYWGNLTDRYSSWYDFNLDGRTNHHDLRTIIDGKFPRKCPQ